MIVHKEVKDEPRKVLCNTPVLTPVKSDKDYQVTCGKCLKILGMQNKVSTHEQQSQRVSQKEKMARGLK